MKNFFKFLGIISMVLIIGFSMTACGGDDDDGGDPNPNPGGGGGSAEFPAEFVPDQATLGKVGRWGEDGVNNTLYFQNSSTGPQVSADVNGKNVDIYKLVSISGKTIKVKGVINPTEITLCTDYTFNTAVTPNTLTLTGGTGFFADNFNNKALVFEPR